MGGEETTSSARRGDVAPGSMANGSNVFLAARVGVAAGATAASSHRADDHTEGGDETTASRAVAHDGVRHDHRRLRYRPRGPRTAGRSHTAFERPDRERDRD